LRFPVGPVPRKIAEASFPRTQNTWFKLPAGTAATAAAASTATATTAAAAASATATAAASAESATAATTTAAASRLRTGFIDVHGTAAEFRAVELIDCVLRFRAIRHFNECKATRLAGVAIRNDIDPLNGSERRKCRV
jgi:hypothetical protein